MKRTLKDEVIYAMTFVFHKNKIDRLTLGITKVEVRKKLFRKAISVTVELEHVGIFIGRKGCLIDEITEEIEKQTGMKTKIHLFETKLWRNSYIDYTKYIEDEEDENDMDDFYHETESANFNEKI